jgi:hypothetical protein
MWMRTRGQQLQGVDEGVVLLDGLPALGLIEQELRVLMTAEAGEVHRGPHQVASELVEPLGVAGVDGGSVVNSKTGVAPGE